MSIPFKSEEISHRGYLKYQKELEKSLDELHRKVETTLNNILTRNINAQGTINKTKIKLIVDKYMTDELKTFKKDLTAQIKAGVADSANMGMKTVIAAVAPHRNITSAVWTDLAATIRKNILSVRGVDGLTLSERIWKLTQDNTHELKKIIAGDILQGKSAASMSRDIRGFLRRPETLRGAVKDALHPGRGVYKSAYKNAMRVTRTETNKADIDGQALTAKKMGYKLQLKTSGIDPCPECLDLEDKVFDYGEFPAPVHPQCMCFALTVLPEES